MADEITITAKLAASKSNLSVKRELINRKATLAGSVYYNAVQSIGFAADEAIAKGDVGTEGWAYFRNLDGTNFVKIGVKPAATFYPLIRLEAGEPAILRLEPGITIYAQADTGAVALEVMILED